MIHAGPQSFASIWYSQGNCLVCIKKDLYFFVKMGIYFYIWRITQMKQKLTRALIDEIRKEMPVLSQNEEKGVIGGTLYVIGEDGRVLYSNETNSDEVLVSMGSWDGAPTMKLPQGTSFQISSGQLVIEGTSEQNREIYSFLTQNTSVEWSMCVDSSTYHFFAGTNHQEKEVSMAYSGCDIKYHNHQSEYANYPSDADYETKSKLQEIGYKEFYIYHEPTDTYIPY